jgi:hypothetical protein
MSVIAMFRQPSWTDRWLVGSSADEIMGFGLADHFCKYT